MRTVCLTVAYAGIGGACFVIAVLALSLEPRNGDYFVLGYQADGDQSLRANQLR
jgi:hypothetical protein